MINYAYLRVSTDKQNNEKFLLQIKDYCRAHAINLKSITQEIISGNIYWRKRKIQKLLDNCKPGDRIITPELSRLGRSMLDIMEIAAEALRKDISIYSIKNDFTIKNDLMSKILLSSFSLASEIEREFLSVRVKEALENLKSKGYVLGRPKGLSKKTQDYLDKIHKLKMNGKNYNEISEETGLQYYQVYYIINNVLSLEKPALLNLNS